MDVSAKEFRERIEFYLSRKHGDWNVEIEDAFHCNDKQGIKVYFWLKGKPGNFFGVTFGESFLYRDVITDEQLVKFEKDLILSRYQAAAAYLEKIGYGLYEISDVAVQKLERQTFVRIVFQSWAAEDPNMRRILPHDREILVEEATFEKVAEGKLREIAKTV